MSDRAISSRDTSLRLASVFTSHMILQRGAPVPIWGWARPGEVVGVRFTKQFKTASADANGRWLVTLDPLAAGTPFTLTVTAGDETVTIENVAVGDVWLASGQSNMEWPVSQAANAAGEIEAAHRSCIRLFTVKKKTADQPRVNVTGAWQPCSPATVGAFSAVGYFFARELQHVVGVPIGIINASWDGSRAEAWTPRGVLEADPQLKVIVERTEKGIAEFLRNSAYYEDLRREWELDVARAEAEGRARPCKLDLPIQPGSRHRPGCLFNGMVAPLIPFAIKGVIWYQGEANTHRADEYRVLFPTLIRSWRDRWGQGVFPFLFVQLANYAPRHQRRRIGTDRALSSKDSDWARLREAQAQALAEPRTGMAVAIDIGEALDIHARNKQDVGQRLALAAQAIGYDRQIVCCGPTYESVVFEGQKAIVTFKDDGAGLCAHAESLGGFAVAGADRRFRPARATIRGTSVEVWSPQVAVPVAVRYAWHVNPRCDLYNREGLPAAPFRTDDWPRTHGVLQPIDEEGATSTEAPGGAPGASDLAYALPNE
jgi:sialate O-acetylesterase